MVIKKLKRLKKTNKFFFTFKKMRNYCLKKKQIFFINKKNKFFQQINNYWASLWSKTTINSKKNIFNNNINKLHTWSNVHIKEYLKTKKDLKKKIKSSKYFEKYNLKKLSYFFKFFGFRKNKNRPKQKLKKTKKFKKFSLYKKILNFFSYNTTYKDESKDVHPLQSVRTFLSYYKMRWQSVTYFLKNYFSPNLERQNILKIAKTTQNFQKNKIIAFISKIEFTLSSMLLKMRLLATRGLINQFIKHGNVYINYKKITYPLYRTKIGDTISIFINKSIYKFHRIYDPLYASRHYPGLYRKNTGRQSPAALEPQCSFSKNSLSSFKKKKNINISLAGALNYTYWNQNLSSKVYKSWKKLFYFPETYLKRKNIDKFANWKHSFISTPVSNLFLKQKPSIDKIFNFLI